MGGSQEEKITFLVIFVRWAPAFKSRGLGTTAFLNAGGRGAELNTRVERTMGLAFRVQGSES